jgi:hypothetical protein
VQQALQKDHSRLGKIANAMFMAAAVETTSEQRRKVGQRGPGAVTENAKARFRHPPLICYTLGKNLKETP